ncbi:MAG: peptide deformylase [Gemmataceae bacterium]
MEPGKSIVKYPHPSLRYPAKPVAAIDKQLRLYAGRMLELMYKHEGLGLAGPQVALPLQILVMNFSGKPEDKEHECVAVNPVILERKGTQEGSEGCLSFPDLYQKVRRAKTVTVRAYNLEGQLYEMTCSDLPSRLWQHEIDHLSGKLFIDVMSTIGRMSSRSYLKAFEAEYRQAQKKGEIESDTELQKQLAAFGTAPSGPVL